VIVGGSRRDGTINFRDQIYVSKAGKIFDRQLWGDTVNSGATDTVSAANTEQLRFYDGFGFRRFNFDAPAGKKSTFVMVTTIAISKGSQGPKCEVSMKYSLKRGSASMLNRHGEVKSL
jgi:hypothetical protein